MEIRVYYESLEQAEFFIKPALKNALKSLKIKNYEIVLIEKVKQSFNKNRKLKKKYAKKISEILIQKNPDIIISIIRDNIEIPIVILEFSTAVFTKDHELQRTDNFNVALSSGAIYIKISPIFKNSGTHGGDTSYQYLEPYSLFYKKYNELSFHINWETEQNNDAIVEKNQFYKSIPSKTKKITELLTIILNTFKQNLSENNWKKNFNNNIKSSDNFKNWIEDLEQLEDFEDIKNINSTRTQWENFNSVINKENVFTLKLNRLGHAMDPERGMLNYYGTFYKNENNVFVAKLLFDVNNKAWYKDTSQESEIEKIVKNGFNKKIDLINALSLGLSLPNYDKLEQIIEKSKDVLIDVSQYIKDNIFSFNTPFRNIIKNADILYITDGNKLNLYLTWDKNSYSEYDHSNCPDITEIEERTKLTEDDVTFITIHNFFRDNMIETISVSYPGAQSDMPILPQPNNGRKQERIYIDAIGIKNNSLIFQENKGSYSKVKINEDINKIIKFKSNTDYKAAVVEFKRKNSLKTEKLYVGIGFGESSKSITQVNTELDLDDIDYFFVLSKDMLSWKVFSSLNPIDDIFMKKNGNIDKIKTYKVKEC
jgi:hypothetical protein